MYFRQDHSTGFVDESQKQLAACMGYKDTRNVRQRLRELLNAKVIAEHHTSPFGQKIYVLCDVDGLRMAPPAFSRHRIDAIRPPGPQRSAPPDRCDPTPSSLPSSLPSASPLSPPALGTKTDEESRGGKAPGGERRRRDGSRGNQQKESDLDEVQAWDRGDRQPLRDLVLGHMAARQATPTTREPFDLDLEIADSLRWYRERRMRPTLETLCKSLRSADARRKATKTAAARAASTLTNVEAKGTRSVPWVPESPEETAARRRRLDAEAAARKAAVVEVAVDVGGRVGTRVDQVMRAGDGPPPNFAELQAAAARAAREAKQDAAREAKQDAPGPAGPPHPLPPHPSPLLALYGVPGGAA
jgi:hypothetical protein